MRPLRNVRVIKNGIEIEHEKDYKYKLAIFLELFVAYVGNAFFFNTE